MTSAARVAILLGTFQGQRFLPRQLDSIAAQTHASWQLWASDDGSSDETVVLLDRFRQAAGPGRVSVIRGPAQGFVRNFASLVAHPAIDADAYAFADQDDEWERDKLERAVRWLSTVAAGTPALYCSRTMAIDDRGRTLGQSPLFGRPPSFANALAQNLASGNTMVFNDAARRCLVEAESAGSRPAFHDWWTYLLVSAAGGRVHYDPAPTVRYRQHGRNQIGANLTPVDRMTNSYDSVWRRLRGWTDLNIAALDKAPHLVTPENARTLDALRRARSQWLVPRVAGFLASGVRRQTAVGDLLLLGAMACRRF